MFNIRTEIKTILFFILYFIAVFIAEKAAPSGVCTPGGGFLLFLLSIPTSIILSLILLFKYYRSKEKRYLNSIYIISGIWVILFLFLNFTN
ncbi:multisubunit Na+/H+ antiporter MnhB subunit [Flavobacterium nitrogenifigens]|uniref:Multisubunit Na+/H+ antiporter MnhB subunit n=2 Tax=Flavobacterium TaxID=237 RepID=A0A7W7IVB0_9FLAO|nr:multisubunit Na+/H+ antiporter MnhB subunit [Flavobacterium nitrogenifigens]MBB6384998.1 multisubunit Na+/H+ antiporter MnhB subunit [Flavobacterium notoginsengisoli]